MLVDAANAVDLWKKRYERTQGAFQEKHIYVTRLEIRVDEIERKIKKIETLEKRLTSLETAVERIKRMHEKPPEDKPKRVRKPKAKKAAALAAVA